jgi:molybdopterin-binding protein
MSFSHFSWLTFQFPVFAPDLKDASFEDMKISARNVLKGKVKSVKAGPISSVVTMEISPGVEITSSITTDSARQLKLKKGRDAWAIIKASNVMIGVDE